MKQFLKNRNYPFILFLLYMIKSVVMPNVALDISVMVIIASLFMGERILHHLGNGVDEYFKTKNKVISENEFRLQVSNDMGKLTNEIQQLKLQAGGGFQNLGRKR